MLLLVLDIGANNVNDNKAANLMGHHLKTGTHSAGLFGLTDRVMLNESIQSVPLLRCQYPEFQFLKDQKFKFARN